MTGSRIDDLRYRVRNLLRRRGFEVVQANRPSPGAASDGNSLLALHLHFLFGAARVDTMLDVGARVGDFGIWLRRNGFEGRIVSFEPVESNFEHLVRRSAADDAWDAVNIALGSEDGASDINVTRATGCSSFLDPTAYSLQEFGENPVVDHAERVEVRRLDGVLADFVPDWRSRRLYLKMDTQGWDLEVLRGASGVLSSTVALQSEVSVRAI